MAGSMRFFVFAMASSLHTDVYLCILMTMIAFRKHIRNKACIHALKNVDVCADVCTGTGACAGAH